MNHITKTKKNKKKGFFLKIPFHVNIIIGNLQREKNKEERTGTSIISKYKELNEATIIK